MSAYCTGNVPANPSGPISIESLYSLVQALHERLDRVPGQVAPEWLSIEQAAALTSLSKDHVRRAIVGGTLVSSNVGTPDRPLYRVSRENIGKWMKEREAGPKPPLRKGRLKKSKLEAKPLPPSPHFPQSRRTPASPSSSFELSL